MKQTAIGILILLAAQTVTAQTIGLSYQAIIINPVDVELPRVDASNTILPNAQLAIRFTIFDQDNQVFYQEVQTTQTDIFGAINLMIGQGGQIGGDSGFNDLIWDGTPRSLQVDIDFSGSGNDFVDMSTQELTFIPYSFNNEISATGDMVIGGDSELTGSLSVEGETTLNDNLVIEGGSQAKLTGGLEVDGNSNFNNGLNVANGSDASFTGTLNVDSETTLNNKLKVGGITNFKDNINVTNGKAAGFSGPVTIDGATDLNNSLTVSGSNSTTLTGNLVISGESMLNNRLRVTGPVALDDALDVTGKANFTDEVEFKQIVVRGVMAELKIAMWRSSKILMMAMGTVSPSGSIAQSQTGRTTLLLSTITIR